MKRMKSGENSYFNGILNDTQHFEPRKKNWNGLRKKHG